MNDDIRKKFLKRDSIGTKYTLRDFKKVDLLVYPKYPNVIKSKGDSVKGLIFEVSNDEIKRLNEYETQVYEFTFMEDFMFYTEKQNSFAFYKEICD